MKKSIFIGIFYLSLFTGGCTRLNHNQNLDNNVQQQKINLICDQLIAGLPQIDKKTELTGTIELFNGEIRQVVRFGKIEKRYPYFISVLVPGTLNKTCSDIPLDSIKEIAFIPTPASVNNPNGGSYLLTLKNDHNIQLKGSGIPIGIDITPLNSKDRYTSSLGGISPDDWFWYTYKNPITQHPMETGSQNVLNEIKRLTIN